MKKPVLWSIAGHDPTGLAGSQVDLETFKHFGVEACAIISAVTAQNSSGVMNIEPVSAEHVGALCEALRHEFHPKAIKIGMLGTSHEKILQFLSQYSGCVVLDPVLHSSSGDPLIFIEEKQHIKHLINLFPYVDVVTPNRPEAEKMLNLRLNTTADIQKAAFALLNLGAKSVLLKGGHMEDPLFCQDYWTNGTESFWIANQRLPDKNYRGTGCTLASAIAACLALNYSIKDAIVIAKMYLTRGIRYSREIGPDTAKLFHGSWPQSQIDLPFVDSKPITSLPYSFKPCPIGGLYPVVDGSHWLEKLLPLGVQCIQLRIKNRSGAPLEEEIKRSIGLAKQYKATLFINDYWELAIRFGAEGVHLGQEDLDNADIEKIYKSGLYLGISTHCYYEVARAHRISPSYIACGPIYPTTSKIMPFDAQGIESLHLWRKTLQYPLVAIGGINLERLPQVLETGVEGIALISTITKAPDPECVTRQFLKGIQRYKNVDLYHPLLLKALYPTM